MSEENKIIIDCNTANSCTKYCTASGGTLSCSLFVGNTKKTLITIHLGYTDIPCINHLGRVKPADIHVSGHSRYNMLLFYVHIN